VRSESGGTEAFSHPVHECLPILSPVSSPLLIFPDVGPDHPVPQRQRGVDRPVDEGGALLMHLPDGSHQRGEVQFVTPGFGCSVLCDGIFFFAGMLVLVCEVVEIFKQRQPHWRLLQA
jgi:hypothetical protein